MPRNEFRPITYSYHAKLRMEERGITKQGVEQAIRSGAWAPNAGEGWISRATFNGRTYDIVFVEKAAGIIEVLHVVTVILIPRGR